MTTQNMGSPTYPEGLPHWSLKHFLARQLQYALDIDQPILGAYFHSCDECQVWQKCNLYPVIENLLEDVVSISVEEPLGNRIPDITLHRNKNVPRIIEVVDTSPMDDAKVADYRRMGVEAFEIRARTSEDVRGILRASIKGWLNGRVVSCRLRQCKRLRELWNALESSPDATFGVEQPEMPDIRDHDAMTRFREQLESRRVKEDFYIGQDGTMISRFDSRPAYQRFVVAGKTVSKADLLSVIGHTKLVADLSGLTHMVGSSLWEMIAVMRHANGPERNTGRNIKPMLEYPKEDMIAWESARRSFGNKLLYYERIFHPKRNHQRMLDSCSCSICNSGDPS